MKNKIFAIIFAVILAMQVCVFAEIEPVMPDAVRQNVEENVVDIEKPALPKQNNIAEVQSAQSQNIYKKPISKKKIAKKFIFAMLGVAISSILIFGLLSLYNKVREKISGGAGFDDMDVTLRTPENIVDAVKIFLAKNK